MPCRFAFAYANLRDLVFWNSISAVAFSRRGTQNQDHLVYYRPSIISESEPWRVLR